MAKECVEPIIIRLPLLLLLLLLLLLQYPLYIAVVSGSDAGRPVMADTVLGRKQAAAAEGI